MMLRIAELKSGVLALLMVLTILFYGLALTGCLSNSLSSIFLAKVVNDSTASVNVGYFSICLAFSNKMACASTSGSSTVHILDLLQQIISEDIATPIIEDLIETALDLQKTVFTPIFTVAGVIFSISIGTLAILILYTKRSRSQGIGDPLRRAMLFFIWTSATLAFAAAFSFLQVIAALNFPRGDLKPSTRITGGTASQALHWLSFSFNWLSAVGASIGYRSTRWSTNAAVGKGTAPPPAPPVNPQI